METQDFNGLTSAVLEYLRHASPGATAGTLDPDKVRHAIEAHFRAAECANVLTRLVGRFVASGGRGRGMQADSLEIRTDPSGWTTWKATRDYAHHRPHGRGWLLNVYEINTAGTARRVYAEFWA